MTAVIDDVQVVVTDTAPGEDSRFVALHAGGTTGWYGPIAAEIGQFVETVLTDSLIGASADDHIGLHAALRHTTAANYGSVASWAVGAVDCAAWDLHAQLAEAPVAELLGMSLRWQVPLYASWLSLDLSRPACLATVEHVGRAGWQFTKWGLRRSSDASDLAAEATRLAATAHAVAQALGRPGAFDAVFTWNPALAGLLINQWDPAVAIWLEDPLPEHDLGAYRPLAAKVPLAVGERLHLHADAQEMFDLAPRAFTLDVVACGGLTRAVELVNAAYALGVPVYPHGRSIVPAIHLAAAFPDAIPAVEYRLQWEPTRQQGYAHPWEPTDGMITVPRSPGLGATPRRG